MWVSCFFFFYITVSRLPMFAWDCVRLSSIPATGEKGERNNATANCVWATKRAETSSSPTPPRSELFGSREGVLYLFWLSTMGTRSCSFRWFLLGILPSFLFLLFLLAEMVHQHGYIKKKKRNSYQKKKKLFNHKHRKKKNKEMRCISDMFKKKKKKSE